MKHGLKALCVAALAGLVAPIVSAAVLEYSYSGGAQRPENLSPGQPLTFSGSIIFETLSGTAAVEWEPDGSCMRNWTFSAPGYAVDFMNYLDGTTATRVTQGSFFTIGPAVTKCNTLAFQGTFSPTFGNPSGDSILGSQMSQAEYLASADPWSEILAGLRIAPLGVLFQGFTYGAAVWGYGHGHVQEAPEPGTLALLGFGLAGLGLSRRRKAD